MSNKKRKLDELSKLSKNNNAQSVKELIQLKRDKKTQMFEYEQRIKNIKKDIREIEKKIYKKCEHNWERDYSCIGLYTKPETVCTKCNLYKDYYYYFSH